MTTLPSPAPNSKPLDVWSWLARNFPHWFNWPEHRRMMFAMLERIAAEEARRP